MNTPYQHKPAVQASFRKQIRQEYTAFLLKQSEQYLRRDCLKMDLHCHDHNSDEPDELWGRILGLPETWLKTDKLIKVLKHNQCSAFTITNHNNARSCWNLKDAGFDILSGAEFTCFFPENQLYVHVLSYGFTPAQEIKLNHKRHNIYKFLSYAAEHNIPVSLAHPLYFYTRNKAFDTGFFEKFALLFERFEVMNGQRDYWQNHLTLKWVQSITPEQCEDYARKHKINPDNFGVDINKPKILTGGSDDHMGIFAGECGSWLYVPELEQRLKTSSRSELALEAIQEGRIAPYGSIYENQKLNIALMDYFAQVATKMQDPGLLRILFHNGSSNDKLACFALSNFILELKRHGKTQMFFKFVHNALTGKKMNKLFRWHIAKDYRFAIKHLNSIAQSRQKTCKHFIRASDESIADLFRQLNILIIKRLKKQFKQNSNNFSIARLSTEEIARQFEIPSQLRAIFYDELSSAKHSDNDTMSHVNIARLFDELSFPVLVAIMLAASLMTSTRLLYQNRSFLNQFSDQLGQSEHPKKALWLTDTLFDRNGVSSILQLNLKAIQEQKLDIDFLVCHPDAQADKHLHVVRPLNSLSFNSLGEQTFHIPDILEIKNIFYQGEYDRIICSTEAPMGLIALLLKYSFNVPCYFYMHTDWLEYIHHSTRLTAFEQDRIRRVLRFFYRQFDGIFVLNSDHKKWLAGHEMQIPETHIHQTAHWVKKPEKSAAHINIHRFLEKLKLSADKSEPVLLYAGRLSQEKGILELPNIIKKVKKKIPDIRLVIAGTGPAEYTLRKKLPEATFLGWVDQKHLAKLYTHLDLFVFPSRFDTFGNVILEAFSYGMPVVAYKVKGPKDIIQHKKNGFLAKDIDDIAKAIIYYFTRSDRNQYRHNALKRSQEKQYQADYIMEQFQQATGLKSRHG